MPCIQGTFAGMKSVPQLFQYVTVLNPSPPPTHSCVTKKWISLGVKNLQPYSWPAFVPAHCWSQFTGVGLTGADVYKTSLPAGSVQLPVPTINGYHGSRTRQLANLSRKQGQEGDHLASLTCTLRLTLSASRYSNDWILGTGWNFNTGSQDAIRIFYCVTCFVSGGND
jgi:hypothetical protein